MPNKHKRDVEELLLEAHQKGIEQAIDLSIRTGVPLVVEENGKIKEIKPQYMSEFQFTPKESSPVHVKVNEFRDNGGTVTGKRRQF